MSGAATDATQVLAAYDPASGEPRWTADQGAVGVIQPDPRHGALIVSDTYTSDAVGRFDESTGERLATTHVALVDDHAGIAQYRDGMAAAERPLEVVQDRDNGSGHTSRH